MNKKDNNRVHEFYATASLTSCGDSAKSVGWSDQTNQTRRFDILLNVADLRAKSILDVGCGLGDLYGAMKKRDLPIASYTGIDIIPEFISRAKEHYPEVTFLEKDIFEVTERFDYVLASGALSFKVTNNKKYYFSMIKKMYTVANKGVAFNMLDNENHIDNDTYAAYSPKEVSDFCSTFADRVEVAIGYLPQDFTMYLYKN